MPHHVRHTGPGRADQLAVVDVTVAVLVPAADTDGDYELFELTGPVGSGAPLSRHGWAEAYYVVEGGAEVAVGARRFALAPGDAVTIPPSAAHSLVLTEEGTRLLVLSDGADGGRFFADMDATVRLADGPDVFVPRIVEVAERHGVTLLQEAPA
jgi:mannose-6-phosphate isomerase-like protein (cupin superfamily)